MTPSKFWEVMQVTRFCFRLISAKWKTGRCFFEVKPGFRKQFSLTHSEEMVCRSELFRGCCQTADPSVRLTCLCKSQIQDISVETEDNKEKKSAKDALLLWCQMKTAG